MLRVRLRGQQLQRQREQERLQRLQEQEQQAQQQRQQPVPPVDEHRLRFQVGGLFGVEFTHFVVGHGAVAADAPGAGAGAGAVDGAADQQQPQQPAAQEQQLPADQGPQQQQQPPPEVQQQEGQLEQPQPQPQPQPQGGQQRQVEQEQEAPPPQPQLDENEPGAVAAQAIRAAGAGLGRLIGGALAMPTIARVMGALLLRISHVLPFVRTIIAPRSPPGPASAFVGLLGPRLPLWRLFGAANPSNDWPGGFGAKVLGGFFATSQEWAMSDPFGMDVLLCDFWLNDSPLLTMDT
ncbi:hypothetical protein BC826DRAFT_735103 [Russula brevipes]|nr:hypothetical protein BC826DRAFT_735103 [Russula brevipes]